MPQTYRRISLNKLKVQKPSDLKAICILAQFNGKNMHKSYQQKFKDGFVNFFGESFEIQIKQGQYLFKIIEINQKGKENVLQTLSLLNKKISIPKRDNLILTKGSFTLNLTSQPCEINEDQDDLVSFTDCNMSELNHQVFSDQMLERKYKKCFSLCTSDFYIQDQFKSTSSEIHY